VETDVKPRPGAPQVVAHPAAIALALMLLQVQRQTSVVRSVAQVFEPVSERGQAGIEELQQQTVNLLSFKTLPKAVFDAQVSFNLLASYGEEAPAPLAESEARITRHLSALVRGRATLPSLCLLQAPVFHGHSFSVWMEFAENPGARALEQILNGDQIDVRGGDLEPPNLVSVAGQFGVSVGAVRDDAVNPHACWVWMVADNLRLMAQNAVMVARDFLV